MILLVALINFPQKTKLRTCGGVPLGRAFSGLVTPPKSRCAIFVQLICAYLMCELYIQIIQKIGIIGVQD
jgi:hypothetical protein